MKIDIRTEAAKYYDSNPSFLNDVPFYQKLIPSPTSSILELGCGTGRVTVSLAAYCKYIQGIDISPAMISKCREKLINSGIPPSKAQVMEGDITDFDLDQSFDLIIAPFRVLQNLETDQEVDGLFGCIRRHLANNGTCILNVFRPYLEAEGLRKQWVTTEEKLNWEVPLEGGRLVCHDRRPYMDVEKLILYPELIYRRYEGETLIEQSLLKIAMRCYYPDTFEKLIVDHGYKVLNRWGGYEGEVYGRGPELVIQFGEGTQKSPLRGTAI
jgi:SAM-dependent methyltransferase